MERLVEENYSVCEWRCDNRCDREYCNLPEIYRKIKDYQNTNLEPEQIIDLKSKYKMLAKENRKLKMKLLKMKNKHDYARK